MKEETLKEQLVIHAKALNTTGLSVGKSGNLSARFGDSLLITPTGIPYASLTIKDIVQINFSGEVLTGQLKPSSEWHFHAAIYRQNESVQAIVHTHSTFCTAIACTRREIAAFHYMVAEFGGENVRCANYATFGTENLATATLKALEGRTACLLANHGAITTGSDVAKAFQSAENLEALAKQYCEALKIGQVKILDTEEMHRVLEKFKSYGQQDKNISSP